MKKPVNKGVNSRKLSPKDGDFESESVHDGGAFENSGNTPDLQQAAARQAYVPTEPTAFADGSFPLSKEEMEEYQKYGQMTLKNNQTKPNETFDYATAMAVTGFFDGVDVRNADHYVYNCASDGLLIEVMGGISLKTVDRMRATLKVSRAPLLSPLHTFRNTLDLFSDNQVKRFVRDASEKLQVNASSLNDNVHRLIHSLEHYRSHRRKSMEPDREPPRVVLTAREQTSALELLNDPNILEKIKGLLCDAGLVGEEDNGLLLFLVFLTRQFAKPLHALVHGSSGSGKTNLVKTVIGAVPEEQCHITTALTENVLFYPPYKEFWKHKVLLLEDLDGSMSALYSLREFMSNGHIVKYTTEMDTLTGEHKQRKLQAHGPVCIVGATTRPQIYEDNSNRSYLIHVDESASHQRAVMDYQNREAAGVIDVEKRFEASRLLKNVQRMLDPTIEVRNPYQPDLQLPACVFKPLRTNQHYIYLIKAITYLHQFQRVQKKDQKGVRYIETTFEDIAWANKLARESLLRKSDFLNGQQRQFFEGLKTFLRSKGIDEKNNESFNSKEVREHFRLHTETLKRHFHVLQNLGFILQTGFNRKTGYDYCVQVWDDYEYIQNGLRILDDRLKELKTKRI